MSRRLPLLPTVPIEDRPPEPRTIPPGQPGLKPRRSPPPASVAALPDLPPGRDVPAGPPVAAAVGGPFPRRARHAAEHPLVPSGLPSPAIPGGLPGREPPFCSAARQLQPNAGSARPQSSANRRSSRAQLAAGYNKRPGGNLPAEAPSSLAKVKSRCRFRPTEPSRSHKGGGRGGIRTLGRGLSPYNRLAGDCLRPLGHPSARSRPTAQRATGNNPRLSQPVNSVNRSPGYWSVPRSSSTEPPVETEPHLPGSIWAWLRPRRQPGFLLCLLLLRPYGLS